MGEGVESSFPLGLWWPVCVCVICVHWLFVCRNRECKVGNGACEKVNKSDRRVGDENEVKKRVNFKGNYNQLRSFSRLVKTPKMLHNGIKGQDQISLPATKDQGSNTSKDQGSDTSI